ncbi:hypothetical protein H5410_037869 [Solanum commersonii]|uniref:Reverse transcriptase n=1 Tax=Solanum commersonii TaxID=4109 RepID=A0A9J5Y949_SOLCO|nr:hypothetical protein H5410_037869 [Solanum commersonii]
MDELTRHIQGEVSWCMLFAYDIVLTDEMHDGVNHRWEVWKEALKFKGFRLGEMEASLWDTGIRRMLKWMCGHTRRDMIKNEVIPDKMGVAAVVDKIRLARLRWFGHMKRKCEDAPMRRCERLFVAGVRRGRGRPK